MKPIMKPIKLRTTQPIPMSDNGKYFWLKLIKVCEKDVLEMNSGLAFNPSTNAAIIVKKMVH